MYTYIYIYRLGNTIMARSLFKNNLFLNNMLGSNIVYSGSLISYHIQYNTCLPTNTNLPVVLFVK